MVTMKKANSRKWQIAKRATALGLSVAMALSVVYLNGEEDKSSAADLEGAVEFTAFQDADYLKNSGLDFKTSTTFTLNSPSDKISYALPTFEGTDENGYWYAWYKPAAVPAYVDDATYTSGETLTVVDKDAPQAVLYGIREAAPAVADDPATPDIDESRPAVTVDVVSCSTVDLKQTDMDELAASIDDVNKEVSISGTDVYENVDTSPNLYYGVTSFAYEKTDDAPKTDATQVSGWGTKTSVITSVNASGNSNDGKYNIYKKVELKNAESTLVYFLAKTVERDLYINITGASISTATKTGTLADKNLSISGINPLQDVEIAFTSDDTDPLSVSASDGVNTYTGAAGTVVIPGVAANEGATRNFTVTVSATGKNDVVYNAVVTYSQKPVIDGYRVVGKNEWGSDVEKSKTDGKYYFSAYDTTVKINASVRTADGSERITNVTLNDTVASSKVDEANPNASSANVNLNITPSTPGAGSYQIVATTDIGTEIQSELIPTFYDPDAPTISGLSVKQTGNANDEVITDGKVEGKLSSGQGTEFSFTLKDQGTAVSGIPASNSVYMEIDGTRFYGVKGSGDVWTITVPANTNYKSRTIDARITAYDVAGNKKEESISFGFSNEVIEVSHTFDPVLSGSSATNAGTVKINYTIYSDIELTEFQISAQDDGQAVTDTVVPVAKLGDGAKDGTGKYHYTYTYEITRTASTKINNITARGKNAHGSVGEPDTIQYIGIDLSDPEWEQKTTIVDAWYRSILLDVKYSDKIEGTYVSGVGAESLVVEKGATRGTPVDNGDGSYNVTLEINPSETEAGTDVAFKIVDNVGNPSVNFEKTCYVDAQKPEIQKFLVNRRSTISVPQTGDPIIKFNSSDNILVDLVRMTIKLDGSVIHTIDRANTTPICNMAETKLSELLGVDPSLVQDGRYEITLEVWDKAYNQESSKRDGAAKKTIVFDLDNTPPSVGIELDPEYCKVNKTPKHYENKDFPGLAYDYDYYINQDNVQLYVLVSDEGKNDAEILVDGTSAPVVWTGGTYPGVSRTRVTVSGEGKHTIYVSTKDKANNASRKDSLTFVIDTKKPVITLKANGEATPATDIGYFSKTVDMELLITEHHKDAAENKLVVTWKDNSTGETGSETVYPIEEGKKSFSRNATYKLVYTVLDLAGNPAEKTVTFTVDSVKPVADIDVDGAKDAPKFDAYNTSYNNAESGDAYSYAQYFNRDVTLNFIVRDFNPESVTVTDNGTTVRTLSHFSTTNGISRASYTASSEGEHVIKINARDKSGNSATEQSVTFTIDKTDPVISTDLNGTTFSEGAPERYLTGEGLVAVTVSDANEDEGDLTRTAAVTAPTGGTNTTSTKISEGNDRYADEADYRISYKAVDRAGNESAVRTVAFRIDKTAPELTISSDATDGASTKDVTATYTMVESFYSDMQSAVVRVYKKVDGSQENLVKTVQFKATGRTSTMEELFTEDGEYRFDFDAMDKAGNTGHTSYTFVMDKTAPSLVLDGVKNYDKTVSDVLLEVAVTENFYKTSQMTVEGTRVDIDQKSNPVEAQPFDINSGRESKFSQKYVDDGIYDIKIDAKDKAGNTSNQAVHFTIDKTAPIIGDLSKYDGKRLNKFVWDIDEKELVKDLTVCDVTVYLDGTVYDGISDLADGSHVLKVTAVDELKNESSKEVSFILDQIAPNIIITGIEDKQEILEAANVSISMQIDDDVLDSVVLNGKEQSINNNSSKFTVDQKGDYTLLVKAHDEAGNESTLSWTFSFGSKVNWGMILGIGGGVLLLLIIILLIARQKSWKQKK